jgi:uncharacterized membrane protein
MIPLQQIHPILVHFPIVFFLTLAAFDVVASLRGVRVTGRSGVATVSFGLAALAGIFAAVTFYFGSVALEIAETGGFRSSVAEIHEGLGGLTATVLTGWALLRAIAWWRDIRLTGGKAALVPAIEVAGALLVIATAYYGGALVYDLGVNVAHAAPGI